LRPRISLNEGFFSVLKRKRPFVTMKLATSLDGKIADGSGKSRWITGESARRHGHGLRATQDAILTGIGTVLKDNPELTCRLKGREADSPQRIIIDSRLRIPPDAKCLPAWIITSAASLKREFKKAKTLEKKGVRLLVAPLKGKHISLSGALKILGGEGVTRLMVEAGSSLSGAFITQKLVDRLYWFRAPMIIGEKGLPALGACANLPLAKAPRFVLREAQKLGQDTL
jgi:diaminohydroxyphosphoribosylaminopyrimidine deaminase / 5-amino-6-(5-phosphoribosylamino)uracil reductase